GLAQPVVAGSHVDGVNHGAIYVVLPSAVHTDVGGNAGLHIGDLNVVDLFADVAAGDALVSAGVVDEGQVLGSAIVVAMGVEHEGVGVTDVEVVEARTGEIALADDSAVTQGDGAVVRDH